jgi:hypothetical protein
MKTDIFNDLGPLIKMKNKELDALAKEIAEENTETKDKVKLRDLCITMSYLAIKIISNIK